jgi:hypothetical protein
LRIGRVGAVADQVAVEMIVHAGLPIEARLWGRYSSANKSGENT